MLHTGISTSISSQISVIPVGISKNILPKVYVLIRIHLFSIHESINHILGFIVDYEKLSLGGTSSPKPPKIEQKQWYFHYQEVFRVEMGVKISGIYHRIQIYLFGARPFSLGGARMEKPCKNSQKTTKSAIFARFSNPSSS